MSEFDAVALTVIKAHNDLLDHLEQYTAQTPSIMDEENMSISHPIKAWKIPREETRNLSDVVNTVRLWIEELASLGETMLTTGPGLGSEMEIREEIMDFRSVTPHKAQNFTRVGLKWIIPIIYKCNRRMLERPLEIDVKPIMVDALHELSMRSELPKIGEDHATL